ncbi:MAG TPA: RNA polymerase sigma factor [Gemmataceae bacterium]|nr:RNA polymerase sigma factor [Gemmataceae bacterium]
MQQHPDEVRERAVRDAVLAGDRAAWRAWYDTHFDPLAAYVRWRCGGIPDLADDVVQETWLTAVRRLRAFDPAKGAFFGWLCGIASNAARNAVRGRKRRREARLETDPPSRTGENPERVAAALAALPEHYEAVLRAKYRDRRTAVSQVSWRTSSARSGSPPHRHRT